MRNLPRREAGLAVLLVVLLWSALPAGAPSVVTVKPAVSEALRPPAPGEVSLGGYLGGKIDLCIRNRVLAQDAESLIEPFRRREETRWWQSEFWGKWFTSLALAERYAPGPEVAARMRDAVRGLVATQSADGYIGNYSPSAQLEQWDIWGRKYCLLGLLADYESRGDTLALNAARREADFLLSQVGPGKADIVHTGNYRGMASCSVLEPVVWLYRATGDKRYLDFARYIVERIESPDGPRLIAQALDGVPVARRFPHPEKWWGWENGMKAYEMMSCYEGLVELYKVTGQAECLRAAEAAWQSIRDTEINVAGGGSSRECWYGGGRHQARTALSSMETCVSVTWLRFSTRLLALTGDPRYAEAVERTLYNALLGAMTPDGADFAKYSPLEGVRNPGENQCGMTLHCCNANGARALLAVPLVAVMASDSGPVLNLYCAGRTVVRLPSGNRVEIVTETAYPFDSTVTVRVNPARAERFSLRLRVPSWSARTSIEPGRAVVTTPPEPGNYAVLSAKWQRGDSVKLRLDLRGRVERDSSGGSVCVRRGPLVLARDSRLEAAGGVVDDALLQLKCDADGYIELTPVSPGAAGPFNFVCDVPALGDPAGRDSGPELSLRLCDYASAGGWGTGARFRVWLPLILDPSQPDFRP